MSVSTLFIPWECKHYCGKAVLIRNFAKDIGEAYMADVGIKMALGYNPRSTIEWQGDRPSTRMGAIAMLRENLLKARKMQRLLQIKKRLLMKWNH